MAGKTEPSEGTKIDPEKIWKEVERSASRAPEWASLEPPYPVKRDPEESD